MAVGRRGVQRHVNRLWNSHTDHKRGRSRQPRRRGYRRRRVPRRLGRQHQRGEPELGNRLGQHCGHGEHASRREFHAGRSLPGFIASITGSRVSPWQYNPTTISRFELDAVTDTADRYKPDIAGSVINLNGANIQVALLNGTLTSGDVFPLFDLSGGTTLTGSFNSISLPPNSGIWNTTTLATAGTITLTPAFTPSEWHMDPQQRRHLDRLR